MQKPTPKKYTFSEWFFLMLFYHIFRILQGLFFRFSVQPTQRIVDSHKVYFLRIHYYLGWDLNQGRFFGFVLQAQYRLEESV